MAFLLDTLDLSRNPCDKNTYEVLFDIRGSCVFTLVEPVNFLSHLLSFEQVL